MLSGSTPLGYDVGALPSFALPPGLSDLQILHGSCRKPHGEGVRDAMVIADDIINDARGDPLKRPHQLLLTGDQIYADDVAISLLTTLRATANDLLAWGQPEALTRGTARAGTVTPGDAAVEPGAKRAEFIRKQTAFTSDPVEGHLMFLGEFYAMYLLAWSDALWPRLVGPVLPGPGPPFLAYLPTADELATGASAEEQSKIDAQRQSVLPFAGAVPGVRRALANVSTYMMFDDHDVTDDWYLHENWINAFRGSPTSRQIVRNALIAYAVFQDWEMSKATSLTPAGTSSSTPSPTSRRLGGPTYKRRPRCSTRSSTSVHKPCRWFSGFGLGLLVERRTRAFDHRPGHADAAGLPGWQRAQERRSDVRDGDERGARPSSPESPLIQARVRNLARSGERSPRRRDDATGQGAD